MDEAVRQVLSGNKGAATLFYRRFEGLLRHFLQQKVSNDTVVEELLQDTFLSAFDALPMYRGEASVKTWLISIAKHEVADYYRKRYVRKVVEQTGILWDGVAESLTTPEIEWKKTEMSERFDRAFARMSKKYQKIIEMRYQKELSVKEIAKKLTLPFKATESLIFRARIAFAEAYGTE
ncbi:MAG: RNA polymerase sigma factor [bacterium]